MARYPVAGGRLVRLLPALVAGGALMLGGCDAEDDAFKAAPPDDSPDVTLAMALHVPLGNPLHVGTTLQYVLTIANQGAGPATTVVVADTLPPAVILAATAASRGAYDPATGLWTLRDLAAQATATLTITASVAQGTRGQTVVNTARVVATEPTDRSSQDLRAEVGFLVVNAPPVARPDSYDLGSGATLTVPAPGVLNNDYDAEAGPLTLSPFPLAAPRHGRLTLASDGSFSYAHDGGAAVVDSFRYLIVDDSAAPDTGRVTISIAPAPTKVGAPAR